MAEKKGVMKLQIPAVYELECDCDPLAGIGGGCNCVPGGTDPALLERLDRIESKLAELEERVENCDCCDCGEQPGVEVTISLSETSKNLAVGGSFPLVATVGPADLQDKSVTWSTSDPAVATVDQDGNVTAVGVGSATITATTTVGGKSASCAVVVSTGAIEIPDVLDGCEYILPFGRTATQNLGTADESTIRLQDPYAEIVFDAERGITFPERSVSKKDNLSTVLVDVANAEDWTLGFWANFAVTRNPSGYDTPLSWAPAYTSDFQFGRNSANTVDKLWGSCYYPNGQHIVASLDQYDVDPDEWHHYAMSSDGSTYIDGVLIGVAPSSLKTAGVSTLLAIGCNYQGYFDRASYGTSVSNFFLKQDVIFTADQIRQIYAAGHKPYA